VRGSGYQVLKSRCTFSSVLAAVRGRLASTHVVYLFAMNIRSVIPALEERVHPCALAGDDLVRHNDRVDVEQLRLRHRRERCLRMVAAVVHGGTHAVQ